jgi:hypothetical protein
VRQERESVFATVNTLSFMLIHMGINNHGLLQPLVCPFEVMVIYDVGELTKGLICLVSAFKIDLNLIEVYIIRNKAYYFFKFRVMERKQRNTEY